MSEVSVRFLPPAPPLRDALAFYYVVEIAGSEPVEDLLHPEGAFVRILLSGEWRITFADGAVAAAEGPAAVLTGALGRAARVRGGPGRMVAAGLLPAGWALLTETSAAGYVDALSPLSDLVGDSADQLVRALQAADGDGACARALDAWFLERLAARPSLDPVLARAHDLLMDQEVASVADWARRLGCSTRQLERLTRDYIGLPPKRLLRRQRFLRSSASLRAEPIGGWARVIDDRYADQPQFAREFRYFMGLSPSAYFARPTPLTTAAATARSEILQPPTRSGASLVPP